MNDNKSAKLSASPFVNAMCIDVEDMGVMNTTFGKKPMVKFTFEIDELNEYGNKRRLTRLFHKHFHPLSALSTAARKWADRDLAAEDENIGEVDLESFIDMPACIKIEPGAEKGGRRYDNITEILPLNDDEIETIGEPKDTE